MHDIDVNALGLFLGIKIGTSRSERDFCTQCELLVLFTIWFRDVNVSISKHRPFFFAWMRSKNPKE